MQFFIAANAVVIERRIKLIGAAVREIRALPSTSAADNFGNQNAERVGRRITSRGIGETGFKNPFGA
ncbi:hypothetical protein [Burkholderia stagnalis]